MAAALESYYCSPRSFALNVVDVRLCRWLACSAVAVAWASAVYADSISIAIPICIAAAAFCHITIPECVANQASDIVGVTIGVGKVGNDDEVDEVVEKRSLSHLEAALK